MRTRVLLVALMFLAPGVAAQSSDALYARFNALTGFDWRRFDFGPGLPTTAASQWRVPVIAVTPVGRQVSIDVTANYASSTLESAAGEATVSGLTDTQLRVLYTLSRDRTVASLSFNLPTGQEKLSPQEFAVAGALGSNFLAFPVGSVGNGFSATGGVAYARSVGSWNVGLSGSLRYQGSYEPVIPDPTTGALDYSPGAEFRIRAGVDRLLGQRARLLMGLTFSTFSHDEFADRASAGWYHPGNRFIGEFGVLRVLGRGSVSLLAWDYYRLAGVSNGTTDDATKENVFNAELRWTTPVAPRVQLEPLVGFRQYSPADYRGGRLYSGGLTARVGLTERWSASLAGRYDSGWVFSEGIGRADVTGYGMTVFLRYQR